MTAQPLQPEHSSGDASVIWGDLTRSILTFEAAALALAITAAPAMAQGAAQSDEATEAAPLAVGATVKDKTVTSIGQVTAVKPDPTGK